MNTFFVLFIVLVAQITLGATLNLQGEPSSEDENNKYIFYDIRSTITLKCKADEPIAANIKWFKNDTNVKDIDALKERYTIGVSTDKKESKLILTKLHNNDAGSYSCRVKSGGDRVDFELAGNVAVKLPSNTMTVEGETLRIQCTAVGTKIWIHWTLNDNSTVDEDGEHDDDR